MTRQKQPAPLRREHSSEYTSSADRNGSTTRIKGSLANYHDVKPSPLKSNGHTNGKAAPPAPKASISAAKKKAGLLELVIGVSGIYASL